MTARSSWHDAGPHPARDGDVLVAHGLSISFGGVSALTGIDLTLEPGVIKGLIGPNGAGKTTLLNVLSGFLTPTSGSFSIGAGSERANLTGSAPEAIRRIGIARTFQAGRLFQDLTVFENVAVTGAGLGHSRMKADREADRILDWMDLQSHAATKAGNLAYADQRRAGIARAFAFSPKFLLLDEPAAGMSEHEARELASLLRRMAAETGTGILLVEHNIGMVLELCAHIYVLDGGNLVDDGDPAHIRASATVRQAYLGSAHARLTAENARMAGVAT